jgi:hypothetical protein
MYPLMLYRGGCDAEDYVTVESDQEEAEAMKGGYARLESCGPESRQEARTQARPRSAAQES